MKLLAKFLFLSLAMTATFALTSCGGDDSCADCEAYTIEEGGITLDVPALKACEGDDNGSGGTITQAEIDEFIRLAEANGASCN